MKIIKEDYNPWMCSPQIVIVLFFEHLNAYVRAYYSIWAIGSYI